MYTNYFHKIFLKIQKIQNFFIMFYLHFCFFVKQYYSKDYGNKTTERSIQNNYQDTRE